MQSETSNKIELLKTKFCLDTYGPNHYYLKKFVQLCFQFWKTFYKNIWIDKFFQTISKLRKFNLSSKKAMI